MNTYSYVAKDKDAQVIKAEIQAESEQAAVKLLQEEEYLPISIKLKGEKISPLAKFKNRVGSKDRILFTRQLATLINAGLPLVQSLHAVVEQIDNPGLNKIIKDVITTVESGKSFSEALAEHPKVFSTIYINLVAAGETSGTLDEALERVATQQEKDAAIISKVRGAMIYPAIVLVVIVGVMIFLLLSVLPHIESLYEDIGENLPFITQMLVNVANFITQFWYVVLVVSGLVIYGFIRYLKTTNGKKIKDKALIKMPLFGPIFMKLYMARFSRTSSTLLETGVQMLESLRITAEAVNNVHVSNSIMTASGKVRNGNALSKSLENDPYFLSLVPQMIRIGEQSGAISSMLKKIAGYYEDELDQQIKNISTVIEPALMIVMGILAGVIIAAILLPIYGLVGQSF